MSTYYDFVCDKHKVRANMVCICRNYPERWSGLYEKDISKIREFLIAHANCDPRLVSEFDDAYSNYQIFDKSHEGAP